jgi:hypothetical protein
MAASSAGRTITGMKGQTIQNKSLMNKKYQEQPKKVNVELKRINDYVSVMVVFFVMVVIHLTPAPWGTIFIS